MRNDRELAARIESFDPASRWLPEPNVWHEWAGHYTIIKSEGCSEPHNCAIFQAKGNNVDHWSVMLNIDDKGNLWLNRRRGTDSIIATDMIGESFDIRVRDNGLDYEVFLNGEFVGDGQWERTEEIGFRWGIYVGESVVKSDIMIFVTGAIIDPEPIITNIDNQPTDDSYISPNPSVNGIFELSQKAKWKVYSTTGQTILKGDSQQIDLSTKPSGIYYLVSENKSIQLIKL
ncbi:MAG: T9SS type A sorting domain-containing protein [Cytophagales bacterium]|nr:T9SS type A sorting domain-containing protein [Cytophagales bacterium]